MTIEITIGHISVADILLRDLISQHFSIEENTATSLYEKRIKPLISKLKDNIYLLAETEYVDRVYRDSYYLHFSSKLNTYKRNCIRISFFDGPISDTDFRNKSQIENLRTSYLGFFLLRPTYPAILGRNLISPRSFKDANFSCIIGNFQTTVNSIKFSIEGFPHSSQDTETISCAETTIWTIMEYFGNHYAEYQPALPSKIIQTLNKVSSERQIPSKGLTIEQISFALREFGFGPRIYSRKEYKTEFNELLAYYIESGIPLVLALEDYDAGIGHSLLCIGRKNINPERINNLTHLTTQNSKLSRTIEAKHIKLYDFSALIDSFIFIDDNHTSYQAANLETPTNHYPHHWRNCKITHFIVPLHQKIHLEAHRAKDFFLQFLLIGPIPLNDGTESILRFFLASSRTFKNHLSIDDSLHDHTKAIILEIPMPKFIWVCEITSKDLIQKGMINGIIILDATEPNLYDNKPLLIGAYQNSVIFTDGDTKKLEKNSISLQPFNAFIGNLKPFHS